MSVSTSSSSRYECKCESARRVMGKGRSNILTMEYRPLYNVKYTFRHEIKYKEKEKHV